MASKKQLPKKKKEDKVVSEDQDMGDINPEAVAAALADLEAIESERIGFGEESNLDEDDFVSDDEEPSGMTY